MLLLALQIKLLAKCPPPPTKSPTPLLSGAKLLVTVTVFEVISHSTLYIILPVDLQTQVILKCKASFSDHQISTYSRRHLNLKK